MEQPTITPPAEPVPKTIKENTEIILVIPAYNDGPMIGSVILKAKPLVSKIIVVDDGSKDRTSEVAHLAGAEVIRFQNTKGKGAACIEGLKRAYQTGCKAAVMIGGIVNRGTKKKSIALPFVHPPMEIPSGMK